MTRRQFYDWQTAGGGGDVVVMIGALEKARIPWCVIGGLADTLAGKVLAWRDSKHRPSKRQKDLLDITRLVESHPELLANLPPDIVQRLPT